MLERVGNKDVFVKNYTSNFDVKEFIQSVLIPKAFPDIPINKLNLGFTGIVSEMLSQSIEDAYSTASLMLNEAFITKSILPDSIYSHAALFDLGYTFAVPSRANFAVQIWLDDIIKYSTKIINSGTTRYILDKDTKLILGDNTYRFDYDVIIDSQYIDGKRSFNIYYDMSSDNSISTITNQYIKHQITSIGWLVLFVELREYGRKIEENAVTDNLVTTNSDIFLRWTGQIAGLDLTYITPRGERLHMEKRIQYSKAIQEPFAWYSFYNENMLKLMFSSSRGYFQPAFNSKIESTIYTCNGLSGNFDTYDNKSAVPVQRTGERFEYNANTRMVALCYSGSKGGTDRGDIELLRDDILTAYNTVKVLSTDYDLKLWFNNFGKRYDTIAEFFKRRDDPTGRLFSQFVAITENTYIYPTNTLGMDVKYDEFDHINDDNEFIIKPGHLWEYADEDVSFKLTNQQKNDIKNNQLVYYGPAQNQVHYNSITDTFWIKPKDRVRMIHNIDGPAMVTDEVLPTITKERAFIFTNPFYMKVSRSPVLASSYNYLINHTSWPNELSVNTEVFYQFQLATLSIERTLNKKYVNQYRIRTICVPVVNDTLMTYVEGVGEEYPVAANNLRMLLITRTRLDGETGYVEMTPVELRPNGAVLFEALISVDDNLRSDMMLRVDKDKTVGLVSLIEDGPRKDEVYIDSSETSFHFIVMIKDPKHLTAQSIFNDPNYQGYSMTNRFYNSHRDLILYKPMNMMRSSVTFTGSANNYDVNIKLIPFIKYDIALNDEKMLYFIRAFNDQYIVMEPVLNRLDGNLDFKLYNTYGRSNNYYIGPSEYSDVLWDSNELLDDIYVKIRLKLAVYDRSTYVQTVQAVIDEIKYFFETLHAGTIRDIHASDIIHRIKDNQPNINYIRFLGFNQYDANKQSIFLKYSDISQLKKNELMPYVPEIIRVDSDSVEIIEEISNKV
jgi:hypothetical protein